MAFRIPNEADAFAIPQAAIDSGDFETMIRKDSELYGHLWGLDVNPQGSPNMSVTVTAGQAVAQGYYPFLATTSLGLTAADSLNFRFDLVTINALGSAQVIAGSPGSFAAFPSLPASHTSLAAVYVPAGATQINSQNIIDKRIAVPDGFTLVDEFVNAQITTTGATSQLGWSRTAGGTAADAWQASEVAHSGIWRLQTGTSSGNNSRNYLGTAVATAVVQGSDVRRMRFLVRIPTITTAAVRLGFCQDATIVASNGIWGTSGAFFEYGSAFSTQWQSTTRNNASSTTNSSGIVVNAGSWYLLEASQLANSNWQFAINRGIVATHTANAPTSMHNFGMAVYTATGAARNIDVDLAALSFTLTQSRWTP